MDSDISAFQKIVAQLIEPKIKKVDGSKYPCHQYISGMTKSAFQEEDALNDLWE